MRADIACHGDDRHLTTVMGDVFARMIDAGIPHGIEVARVIIVDPKATRVTRSTTRGDTLFIDRYARWFASQLLHPAIISDPF